MIQCGTQIGLYHCIEGYFIDGKKTDNKTYKVFDCIESFNTNKCSVLVWSDFFDLFYWLCVDQEFVEIFPDHFQV